MPALEKPPARLPRFVPHLDSGTSPAAQAAAAPGEIAGTGRGAGTFLEPTLYIQAPSPGNPTFPKSNAQAETLERLAHDARNVLASLMLFGDLLAEPGVLSSEHRHLAPQLDSMTRTATHLMEKIVAQAVSCAAPASPTSAAALPVPRPQPLPTVPVTDLAAELRHLLPLLTAIAGPSVKLSIATMPCAGRTRLAVEDLTRILVNLVRNAADAMPRGGHLRITAQYSEGRSFLDVHDAIAFGAPRSVQLSVADTGPGIPAHLRDKVFDFGFTTRNPSPSPQFPAPPRRGLGLSTVRHLVDAAGGTVGLASSAKSGACFEITLPLAGAEDDSITSGTYRTLSNSTFATDSAAKGHLECR